MGNLGHGWFLATLRLRSVFLFLGLCCLACLSAIPAGADTLPPPSFAVSGSLSILGNDVCGSAQCAETLAFSFDVGYEFNSTFSVYETFVTDLVASASGDLGSLSASFPGPLTLGNPVLPPDPAGLLPGACVGLDANFLAFDVPSGSLNEIDLHLCQAFVSTPAAPPALSGGDLFSCSTGSTCVADFSPFPQSPEQDGLFVFGPLNYTVTPILTATTPEPATLSLLLYGLLLLGVLGVASRKFPAFQVTASRR